MSSLPEDHFITCPLCEATCGLQVTVADGLVSRIRGDRDDVFSKGFICPKGSTLSHFQDDRIVSADRSPDGTGRFSPTLDRINEAQPPPVGTFQLIGRRHLRSNNSWMHNMDVLMRGKDRCTLMMHPDDAASLGLDTGDAAEVANEQGSLTAPVEITDAIRPGVVSLPHGYGHDGSDIRLRVAGERPGVNYNRLGDHRRLDPLSGNAALNGYPVSVTPRG